MLSFLSGFLVFNLLYHIFTTLTIYGWELFSTTIPSLLRESIRCLFILLLFLFNSKQRNAYRKRRKRSRITFVILLVFSVLISYFFAEKNISALFIGIKYGFWRMFILLSATSIGFFYHKKFTNLKLLS
jgi:multidrug transporter EmrE-like cation transporter